MTASDFILGIVSSLIAAFLYDWRHRAFILTRLVTTARDISLKNFTVKQLRITASSLMLIVASALFLSHSPKLASDEMVTQTQEPQALITSAPKEPTVISVPKSPIVQLRPCVIDYSPCQPISARKQARTYTIK
jgi:hypothetical protein